jgi:hypothetical protein
MTNEWIKKNVVFYVVIKKNKMFAGKLMELENFMLSEGSEVQKLKGHKFSLMCGS